MVAGSNGQATRVYRARNAEESPFRYTIHPQDQFKITMEIAEPLYLICSLADSDSPDVRAWAIRDGRVEEVDLDVD